VNPFDQASGFEENSQAHHQWLQRVDSQESSPGGAKRVLSSQNNYTIREEGEEGDVSFNTRSNIFGGVQSPIQRGDASAMMGSEDRAHSSILRGMVQTDNSVDALRIVDQ